MSRGLDNNNPGNIRLSRVKYKGECAESSDPEFRQFESVEWGYRAIFMLLYTYHRRHGCRTLRQMIDRYAPPSENPTSNYLRFVAEHELTPQRYIAELRGFERRFFKALFAGGAAKKIYRLFEYESV